MKKILVFLFFILISGAAGVCIAQDMKIGVATNGPEAGATISEVAGRAPYFLFFDGQGNLLEAMKNPSRGSAGGAGRDTAELMNKKKVTLFVAGRVGERMKNALIGYKIEIIEQTGVAHDVVTSIIKK